MFSELDQSDENIRFIKMPIIAFLSSVIMHEKTGDNYTYEKDAQQRSFAQISNDFTFRFPRHKWLI